MKRWSGWTWRPPGVSGDRASARDLAGLDQPVTSPPDAEQPAPRRGNRWWSASHPGRANTCRLPAVEPRSRRRRIDTVAELATLRLRVLSRVQQDVRESAPNLERRLQDAKVITLDEDPACATEDAMEVIATRAVRAGCARSQGPDPASRPGGGRMIDLVSDHGALDPHFLQQNRMVKEVLFRGLAVGDVVLACSVGGVPSVGAAVRRACVHAPVGVPARRQAGCECQTSSRISRGLRRDS